MNLEQDNKKKTINLYNITEQLNFVTKIIEGSEDGDISDVQLANLNKRIDDLTQEIVNFKVEVEKFIDEEELKSEITMIESKLKDLKDYIDSLQLNVDLTNYYTKIETDSKFIDVAKTNITNIYKEKQIYEKGIEIKNDFKVDEIPIYPEKEIFKGSILLNNENYQLTDYREYAKFDYTNLVQDRKYNNISFILSPNILDVDSFITNIGNSLPDIIYFNRSIEIFTCKFNSVSIYNSYSGSPPIIDNIVFDDINKYIYLSGQYFLNKNYYLYKILIS